MPTVPCHTWVALNDHPLNLDPSAGLVSPPREPWSVYRVAGGFLPTVDGLAPLTLYATKETATAAAIARATARQTPENDDRTPGSQGEDSGTSPAAVASSHHR